MNEFLNASQKVKGLRHGDGSTSGGAPGTPGRPSFLLPAPPPHPRPHPEAGLTPEDGSASLRFTGDTPGHARTREREGNTRNNLLLLPGDD